MEAVDQITRNIIANLESIREVTQTSIIFRVPAHVYRGRDYLFRPHMLSIGPYHHGREEMREMEHIKLQFLKELNGGRELHFLRTAVQRLNGLEEKARNCYFHVVRLGRHEFVKMLLLDGFFIIQFLIKWKDSMLGNVFGDSWWNFGMIMHDLVLLENQIPFFVVQELFLLVQNGQDDRNISLGQLAVNFMMQEEPNLRRRFDNTLDIHHLLHLCYLCYTRRPGSPLVNQPIQTVPINSATRLAQAGVTFKGKTTDDFLDSIDFRHGVLSIPSISVHEDKMYRLANLVALEQCVASVGSDVTNYAIFMDFLIDTPDDVEILRQRGVIGKLMASNKEVADFFNQLCAYCVSNSHRQDLADVLKDVDVYCRSRWHENRAMLTRDYFSNPWASISFAAAAVLLALTLSQTIMSFVSYFLPKSHN